MNLQSKRSIPSWKSWKMIFIFSKTGTVLRWFKQESRPPVSILSKLKRKNVPIGIDSIRTELNDVAGICVSCSFIDDIYLLAEKLRKQDDIVVVSVKYYIKHPKPNGYLSYHMIVEVPVLFSDTKEYVRVELQIRTVAMDFWATLEHDIKYKKRCSELWGCHYRQGRSWRSLRRLSLFPQAHLLMLFSRRIFITSASEIGRAHVWTPVT